MSADESWILRVNETVEYTSVDGSTKSIPPGEHRIRPVHAKGVPTSEAELECWIIDEAAGSAEAAAAHDVDAETVADWQDSGAVEIGEPAPRES